MNIDNYAIIGITICIAIGVGGTIVGTMIAKRHQKKTKEFLKKLEEQETYVGFENIQN